VKYLRRVKIFLVLALVAFASFVAWGYARNHPENVPWTEIDLARPIGAFTGRKLAALGGHSDQCRALLRRAGIPFTTLPRRGPDGPCGHEEEVRFGRGGALAIAYRPQGLGTSCPVAAGLALWEWHVIQPAALRHFGAGVAGIDHFGSYGCRRVYGRSEGAWSEHASANAIDIAAFRLTDGRRISVASDWPDGGAKGRFLHDVRDGACRLFATTLSPDYNAAHRDHLHLDQAKRGAMGWRVCR
jgi:hypothetical protein